MNSRRFLIPVLCVAILAIACAVGFFLWRDPAPADESHSAAPATNALAGRDAVPVHAIAPGGPAMPPELAAIVSRMSDVPLGPASPENEARRAAVITETRRRAAEDPKAAFAWALQQGDLARPALEIVLQAWIRTDPSSAFEAAREIPDDPSPDLRAYAFARVGELWAGADPASAWKAVGTLPASPGTALLKDQILRAWSGQDPAAAAESLKALTAGGVSREDQTFLQPTFAAVAGKLVSQDGPKAAEWATGLPDGTPEQASAVAGVVSAWYLKDAKATGEWLDHMAAGAGRDAGLAAMVQMTAMRDPEVSVEWAQSISDQTLRSNLMAHAAAGWLTVDPKKAEEWLQKTTALTDEQREKILTGNRQLRDFNGSVQGR